MPNMMDFKVCAVARRAMPKTIDTPSVVTSREECEDLAGNTNWEAHQTEGLSWVVKLVTSREIAGDLVGRVW
jgi:hypothetical protein